MDESVEAYNGSMICREARLRGKGAEAVLKEYKDGTDV
jgi:hypothetical protein